MAAEERKVMPIRIKLTDLARLDKRRGGESRQSYVERLILDDLGGRKAGSDRTKPAKKVGAPAPATVDRAEAFRNANLSGGTFGGKGGKDG